MKKLLAIILILSLPVFILAESADSPAVNSTGGQNNIITSVDPGEGIVNHQTDDSTGVVQFMTFFTLPACPPFIPFPVDTFDISAWLAEGSTWMLQPVSLLGTPWADMQPAIDGLEGMMVDIPLGFTMEYDSAKVWVELHVNQNTVYTPGFPIGYHTWPDGMYFEPLAGFPDDVLWINVDFYSYLYTGLDDSLEYGTELNPFVSPLHVSFEAANIQPFVEGLPGYDPGLGTFFNFQTTAGPVSSAGIVPDLFEDWIYDVYHFTPFIGGMNNGGLTQTTISSVSVETEAGLVTTGWITQTEYDSDYFNVYRSAEVIATVPAAGTSSDPIAYEYVDDTAVGGVEYNYEVSVVMTDGSEWVYPEVFTVTPAGPATIHVPGDYPTIQAGIDAAGNGDEVVIADGIYNGAGNKNLDFGGRAITVRSENGAENCIIDCEDDGQGFYFHSGETENSILDGLTIINGNAYHGGGIYCENSSPKIINCVVDNNSSSDSGGGIWLYNSNPIISNCLISNNNSSTTYAGGIECYYYSSPQISYCVISGNSTPTRGAGIMVHYYCDPIITNCTIVNNTAIESGGGIFSDGIDILTGVNNIIWGNSASSGSQIYLGASSTFNCTFSDVQGGWTGEGNIDSDPIFVDPSNDDYNLQASSPCIDAGDPTTPNDPDGTIADIGAFYFDQTQPSTPVEDLVISVEGVNVVLNWEDVVGASGYNVYRSTEPYFDISGLTPVAEPAVSTFEDTGAVSSGAQFYIVTWED